MICATWTPIHVRGEQEGEPSGPPKRPIGMHRLILITALLVGAVGCGSQAVDVSGHMDFPMTTFGGMDRVSSDAMPSAGSMPFSAFAPISAGAPMAVFVSKPAAYPKHHVEVVIEYDQSSPFGPFRVRESRRPPQPGDATGTQSEASFCQQEGGTCTSKLIQLRSGRPAALLYGPDGPTSVSWIERFGRYVYQFTVIGPRETFSPGTATAVADEVASGFDPTRS
jgi:hypothetical protein